MDHLPRRLIELIVFVVTLSSVVTAQTTVPESPALEISVTGITRESPDLFEIHYALKNKGKEDLYLPYHQIGDSIALTTYALLERTNHGDWINISPSYDIASYKAQIVHAGATLNLVEPIAASVIRAPQGPGSTQRDPCSDAEGCHRIRVGYYPSSAAWRQRLATMQKQQESPQTLKTPRIEFAYSKLFVITSMAK